MQFGKILTLLAGAFFLWIGYRYRLQILTEQGGVNTQFIPQARDLIQKGVILDTPFYPPGMTIFYAIFMKIFGDSSPVPSGLLLATRMGEALLAGFLAYRIFGGYSGSIAFGMMTIWPYGIWFSMHGDGEFTPPLFFILLGLHTLLTALRTGSLRWYGVSGLLLGIPGLIRSSIYLLDPFLALFGIWRGSRAPNCWIPALIFVLIPAVLLYLPWTVRNVPPRSGRVEVSA